MLGMIVFIGTVSLYLFAWKASEAAADYVLDRMEVHCG